MHSYFWAFYGLAVLIAWLTCVELTIKCVATLKGWTLERAEKVQNVLGIVGVIPISIVIGYMMP